jgi:DNA-binding HxlR family transcriptional regulator
VSCPGHSQRLQRASTDALQDFSAKLRVLDVVLAHENYAIALPKDGSPLQRPLNAALLEETGCAAVSTRKKAPGSSILAPMKQLGVAVKSPDLLPKKEAFVRDMLECIADKWTLLVIDALEGEKEMRFTRLQERIGGISQKMLTRTLRQLERDGLVTRRVHATVPPRVDYRLTALGVSLGESVCGIWIWVEKYMEKVERARRGYDEKTLGRRAQKLTRAA